MRGSAFRWVRRGALAVAILLVLGFAVGSLAGRSGRSGAKSSSTGPTEALTANTYDRSAAYSTTSDIRAPGAGGVEPVAAQAAAGPKAAPNALGSLDLPPPSDAVIKTADIGIRVHKKALDQSWDAVFGIAARFGGYVVSSSQGGSVEPDRSDETPRSAEIVLRVPARRFNEALRALEGSDVGTVTRRATSGQDVSQEFVDLDSRLRHYRSQETVLLRIMSRARTVGDTIAVQEQLSQVQLQIEEITGRLRYLKDQTGFATISVHLAENGARGFGAPEGPSFSKAWSTAVDGLERMGTAALIGGTWLAPFALLALAWQATRRWRARPAPQP
jgi:hypothetical protein